jgi:hypothetical protein
MLGSLNGFDTRALHPNSLPEVNLMTVLHLRLKQIVFDAA